MADCHRGSAAEIPVTSNGDLDQSPDKVFFRVGLWAQSLASSLSPQSHYFLTVELYLKLLVQQVSAKYSHHPKIKVIL